ncbi:MAG: hypothetical protein IPK97_07315 [Ahniella sp.]|nr:hypothetical protein [Ahniella sp.]
MNPNDPTSIEQHPEWAAQQAALSHAGKSGTCAERDYRSIYAGIIAAPLPALPNDFAVRVLARIENLAESAGPERWLMWILGLAMAVGSVVFAGPMLFESLGPLAQRFDSPWPVMAAAVACVVVLVDRAAGLRWTANRG